MARTVILGRRRTPPPRPQWYLDNAVPSSGDGRSWATAWKSFTNVAWGSVSGGTLNMSGGTSGKTYVGGTRVLASNILIRNAIDLGHSGQATILNDGIANQAGFFIQSVNDITIRGIAITTPTNSNQQTDCIYIQSYPSTSDTKNITIENCSLINANNGNEHDDCVQTAWRVTDLTIRNCYLEQRNNKSQGNAQGLWLGGCNGTIRIYNNIIYMPNSSNVLIGFDQIDNLPGNSYTAFITNNTLVGGQWGNLSLDGQNASTTIVKNNIITSLRTDGTVFDLKTNDPPSVNIDYNIYYTPNSNPRFLYHGSQYLTWNGWRNNHGYDTHSQMIDPRFVNIAGLDFRLQAGSPAIDAGVADPNAPSVDYAGNPRIPPIDIGAYEWHA